ncbi:MAG: DUF975 family protein [Provencibacterium sp.]|jgi:uncharacterized membrane protein|nr:DUF975 family protein [Provencibacterium sp.]
MSVRSKVKINARRVLWQNFIKALIVVLILLCVSFLFSLFMMIANTASSALGYLEILGDWNYLLSPLIVFTTLLLQLILFSPLLIGASKWFYRLVGSEPGDIIDLFDYFAGFKNYFGSVWMELNLFVRSFFYTFLFTVLPILLMGSGIELFNGFWSPEPIPMPVATVVGGMLTIAGGVLLALAGIFSWIFLKRYALSRYLYAEGGCSVRRAIKQSVYFMRGRKAELFLFDLSYLGWLFSCLLVIPAFFVVPYYMSAKALYAKVIIEYGQRGNTAEPPQEPTKEFSSDASVPDPERTGTEAPPVYSEPEEPFSDESETRQE